MRRNTVLTALILTVMAAAGTASAQDQPNILVVWGDDIGQSYVGTLLDDIQGFPSTAEGGEL